MQTGNNPKQCDLGTNFLNEKEKEMKYILGSKRYMELADFDDHLQYDQDFTNEGLFD